MTTLDLDAIRRRCAAATEGPWRWDAESGEVQAPHKHHGGCESPEDPPGGTSDCEGRPTVVVETDGGMYIQHKPDAELISHARTDIPALLALVELQRDALLHSEWGAIGTEQDCAACAEAAEYGFDPETGEYGPNFPGTLSTSHDCGMPSCPCCTGPERHHARDCQLSRALDACGLDTQDKRDAARKAAR